MEIIYLDYSEYKIYNIETGEIVMDDTFNEDSKSLKGLWVDSFFENPIINDENLLNKWNKFLKMFENDDYDFDDFTMFLYGYEDENLIAYEINSCGIACGPVSSTAWYVVDKEIVVEEIF